MRARIEKQKFTSDAFEVHDYKVIKLYVFHINIIAICKEHFVPLILNVALRSRCDCNTLWEKIVTYKIGQVIEFSNEVMEDKEDN